MTRVHSRPRDDGEPHRGIAGAAPGTDGFAIAAFVLSNIGLVPLALIFGVSALIRGRGAGSVGDRDRAGAVSSPGSLQARDLRVGDCLTTVPKESSDVATVDVTPCGKAHRGEVYAAFRPARRHLPGGRGRDPGRRQGLRGQAARGRR